MRAYNVLMAIVLSILSASQLHAGVLRNSTETFESPNGTDNKLETFVSPGNGLDSDFSNAQLPPTWGHQSGLVFVGPDYGGALWMARDPSPSQTGYYFTGSFVVTKDGLTEGQAITSFVSKPDDWMGPLAAWRPYFHKQQGQLALVLVVGLNTQENNPSGEVYMVPMTPGHPYDVVINYDTARRFYSWYLDGQLKVAANMPDDYPLIGTEIIGSSGSSAGRNSIFIVDNVSWRELPAVLPEPASVELLAGAFLMSGLWISVPKLRSRWRPPS